jgi:hypothetical protein
MGGEGGKVVYSLAGCEVPFGLHGEINKEGWKRDDLVAVVLNLTHRKLAWKGRRAVHSSKGVGDAESYSW